jgi:hypothetical protein
MGKRVYQQALWRNKQEQRDKELRKEAKALGIPVSRLVAQRLLAGPSLYHTTRSGELGFGGGTIVLWGPVERPDFVIDEAELPY